jgi:hypothetical protein
MQNQTVNLNAKTNAGSASIPNVLSRILLAAEVVVIIFPLLALASILTFFFVIFWIPMAIGSSIFDPGFEKSLIIVIIGLSAAASIAYLANVTQLSVRYIFEGRSSLQKVTRIEWLILCIGVTITIGWAIVVCLNFGSKSDTTLSANSIFFIPGLLLILPTFHIFLAKKIAEYRLR